MAPSLGLWNYKIPKQCQNNVLACQATRKKQQFCKHFFNKLFIEKKYPTFQTIIEIKSPPLTAEAKKRDKEIVLYQEPPHFPQIL